MAAEYNEKKATTVKPRFNIEATEELSVGVSAVHDTEKFKNIWTQAVYKPADCKQSFYWLRADLVANLVVDLVVCR